MHKNGKFGVAILVMAWALKLVFFQSMYVFIILFVWMCYSPIEAIGWGCYGPELTFTDRLLSY